MFTINEKLASAIAEEDDVFFWSLPTVADLRNSSGDESDRIDSQETTQSA